jgi:hypothetical protein
MQSDFKSAKKTLRTSNSGLQIVAVNGCCYGKDSRPDKGDYFKYCGQQFWQFISGSSTLFTDLIEPLGHQAEQKNEAFYQAYAPMMNRFTHQFVENFCDSTGAINWEKLVIFNSSN